MGGGCGAHLAVLYVLFMSCLYLVLRPMSDMGLSTAINQHIVIGSEHKMKCFLNPSCCADKENTKDDCLGFITPQVLLGVLSCGCSLGGAITKHVPLLLLLYQKTVLKNINISATLINVHIIFSFM